MAKLFKRKYWVVDPKTGERIQKQAENWSAKVKDDLGVWQRVTFCPDKILSGLMLDDLKRKAMKCRAGLADPFDAHRKRPLREHVVDFEKSLEHKGNTAEHCRLVANRARRVIDDCRFRRIADLSASRVQRALAELKRGDSKRAGLSQQTVNFHLQAIKQFCRWLVADRRTGENPLTHLQGGNVKLDVRLERRELSEEEIRWLLETVRSSAACHGLSGLERFTLYAVALGTGLRASELASLTPASFDFDDDSPTVRIEAASEKARRGDVIPLPPDLVGILRPWLKTMSRGKRLWPGKWAAHKYASKFIQHDLKAARAAWLEKAADATERESRDKSDFLSYRNHDNQQADFHSLRHTYLSRLGRSGASPKVMQKLARHSTVELTLGRYTHAGLFDLSSAVNAMPPLPIKVAPQAKRAVLRATGTDDVCGPSMAPKFGPVAPKLAQADASKRQRLRTIDVTDADASFNDNSTSHREFEQQRQRLSKTDKRRERDSNPRYPYGHAGFQDRCIQPLCHLSERAGV